MIKKNDRGIALPLVLVFMLVLSILGTALWQYSMAETVYASRSQQKIESHYVARSGADATAEYIIKNPQHLGTLLSGTGPANRATGSVGNGSFSVYVDGDPGGTVEIHSSGEVGGTVSNLTLLLTRQTAAAIFKNAITQTSTSLLDLWGMTVYGNVESAGEIDVNPKNFFGQKYEHAELEFIDPDIPALDPATSINAGNNPVDVATNKQYASIEGKNNITFITGGNDVQVVVHNMDVKGDIIVNAGASNTGTLALFITGKALLQTPQNYNTDPHRLIVYLAPGAELEIIANGDFNGYIYGPNATVTVQSSDSTVNGAIIAHVVVRNSNQGPNGVVNYVPIAPGNDFIPAASLYRRSFWSE